MQSDSRTKEEAGPRPLGGAEFEPQESEVFCYRRVRYSVTRNTTLLLAPESRCGEAK